MKRFLIMPLTIAALVGAQFVGSVLGPPTLAAGSTLYVSLSGSPANNDTSCDQAAYASIQAAVDAASAGDTINVCPGTYNEQVNVTVSGITINGSGAGVTIVDPMSATPTTESDPDRPGDPKTVPIFYVSGQTGVTISNLTVEGGGLKTAVAWPGCSEDFVGIWYVDSSGTVADTTIDGVKLPPSLFGCQQGLAIYAQSTTGSTSLTVTHSLLTDFDKNGVVCVDANTTCAITHTTITGVGPTTGTAQNGIQIGPGAPNSTVTHNSISAIAYTAPISHTEPQSDYGAGILLYGAAGTVGVNHNNLVDDQIGIESVASSATIYQNVMHQSSPGIDNSVGIFAAACDFYCSYFDLTGNSSVVDNIAHNDIIFPGSPTPGTVGIWTNDSAANSGTGLVLGSVVQNTVIGAQYPYQTS